MVLIFLNFLYPKYFDKPVKAKKEDKKEHEEYEEEEQNEALESPLILLDPEEEPV